MQTIELIPVHHLLSQRARPIVVMELHHFRKIRMNHLNKTDTSATKTPSAKSRVKFFLGRESSMPSTQLKTSSNSPSSSSVRTVIAIIIWIQKQVW